MQVQWDHDVNAQSNMISMLMVSYIYKKKHVIPTCNLCIIKSCNFPLVVAIPCKLISSK